VYLYIKNAFLEHRCPTTNPNPNPALTQHHLEYSGDMPFTSLSLSLFLISIRASCLQ
jgi:hypothetical protein